MLRGSISNARSGRGSGRDVINGEGGRDVIEARGGVRGMS
jgi:hypothetical protein